MQEDTEHTHVAGKMPFNRSELPQGIASQENQDYLWLRFRWL